MKPSVENINLAAMGRSFNAYKIQQSLFDDYWHYHPEIEITYIIKGSGIAFIGNSTTQFEPGMAFLTGPYLPHNFVSTEEQNDGAVECWGLQFRKEWLESMAESSKLQDLFKKMVYGISFKQLSTAEHNAFVKLLDAEPIGALAGFFELLHLINSRPAHDTISSNSAYSNVMSKKLSHRMEVVSKYIQENYQRTITLGEVSDIAAMTEQSFSRWFKQTAGLTFVDYLMQLRTTIASNLLINTSKSMTEVASEAGFNSSSSFNRAFLKIKGCSPREFRKKSR